MFPLRGALSSIEVMFRNGNVYKSHLMVVQEQRNNSTLARNHQTMCIFPLKSAVNFRPVHINTHHLPPLLIDSNDLVRFHLQTLCLLFAPCYRIPL